MIEAIALVAICIGAIAVAISGLTATTIMFAPVVSSPKDKYPFNEEEYQARLRANYESIYMYTEFADFSPTTLPRYSVDT
ncbi:unnamed protein product [Rotaria sordida]|uniref:Uncharacterized protein n=1 Tax=Rotaria sordida TaxID=392033 RepID=A0A820GG09_9BILA|nr:unnamed protein product [Rotaria sordida]